MNPHDGPAAGGRRAAVRERRATNDAALETRLRALGPALDGEPDPAFRAATRARLVAMAAVRTPAPAPVTGWRRLLALRADARAPRRRTRLTAGLAAAALAVTVMATLVAVSTSARPGDVLYGLKRGTEQTQLALAGDSRGQTLLQFAGTRLSELRGLTGDGDTQLAVATLHTMDQQTTKAASWLTARAVATRSTAPIDDLSGWTRGQRAGLVVLQSRLPEGARPAAAHSLNLLTAVGARSGALAAALACPSGPATQGTDSLGPIPAPCPAPPSGSPGTTPASPGGSSTSGGPQGSVPPPVPGTAPPSGVGGSGPGSAGGPGATSGAGVGSGSVGTSTGAIVPTTPPLIDVPNPTLSPLPIPLPGSPTSASTRPTRSAGASRPAPVSGICLPPVIDLGNC